MAADTLIPINTSVWRVSSTGAGERIPFTFKESAPGGPLPAPSPRQDRITFTRGPNLWVFKIATGECQQVTAYPDWPPEGGNIQEIRFHGWTTKGSLLFSVWWGESGPGDGEPGPVVMGLDECKTVVARKTSDENLPLNATTTYLVDPDSPTFRAPPASWTYLGKRPVGEIRPGNRTDLPSWMTQNAYQLFISKSGKKAVAIKTDGTESSQVVEKDFKTGQLRELSPKGGFTDYQWPSFSPSDAKVAFKAGGTLQVDGKALVPSFDVMQYFWIEDDVIAMTRFDGTRNGYELQIARVSDHKVLGTYFQAR